MKKQSLRNSIVIAALATAFCLSTTVLVTSCQNQSFEDELTLPQSSKTKADLPYLEFSSDYTKEGELSDKDVDVFLSALNRAKVSKIDGLWHMSIKDAAEINVSSEIFTYLNQVIESSNAKILPDLATMSITPRQIIPGEGEQLEKPTRSDCVACCLGWINENKGFGPSYEVSNSWINSTYGSGVPSNQMESTLQYFYGPNHVSSFPVNSQSGPYRDKNSAVILNYMETDSTGHAVIYQATDNGMHVVKDPQQGGMINLVDTSRVISAFKVTR